MKKVLKPVDPEQCVYYSDFSGALLEDSFQYGSPVELTLKASYGSKHDGDSITLHLDDKDLEIVTNFLKNSVTADFKNQSILLNPDNSILKQIINQ